MRLAMAILFCIFFNAGVEASPSYKETTEFITKKVKRKNISSDVVELSEITFPKKCNMTHKFTKLHPNEKKPYYIRVRSFQLDELDWIDVMGVGRMKITTPRRKVKFDTYYYPGHESYNGYVVRNCDVSKGYCLKTHHESTMYFDVIEPEKKNASKMHKALDHLTKLCPKKEEKDDGEPF